MAEARIKQFIVIVVGVGLAYVVTGLFGLTLAVPPGYATTIWPPSGIAIAVALLYGRWALVGILLGSLLLNLYISTGTLFSLAVFDSLSVALPIAIGSTIQACIGAILTRKFTGFPFDFTGIKPVLLFSVLAGPVACIIAASIGVLTLYGNGLVTSTDWFDSWQTWWVGDSIGVLVFTPILLVFLSKEINVSARRKYISLALFSGVFIVAIAVFFWSKSSEFGRVKDQFYEEASQAETKLNQHITAYTNSIYAFKGIYSASSHVNGEEFQRFFRYVANKETSLEIASWLELVPDSQRGEYEKSLAIRTSDSNRKIWGVIEGNKTDLPEKNFYYPVTYNSSVKSRDTSHMLGYDPYSDSDKKIAMDKARQINDIYASVPTKLVSAPDSGYALITFLPVFSDETMSPVERDLLGFITGITSINMIVEKEVKYLDDIAIKVVDLSTSTPLVIYPDDRAVIDADVKYMSDVTFAGRTWHITVYPTSNYLSATQDRISVLVLIGCMLFVWVLTILILMASGYHEGIRREVEDKTKMLSKALSDAKAANRAKTQFLASMSHELRTPLNSIIGFTARLQKDSDIKNIDSGKINLALDAVHRNGKQLLQLINDLLDISSIEAGKMTLELGKTDIANLVRELVEQMEPLAESKKLNLSYSIDPAISSKHFVIDDRKVKQIITNLLSNAIKYTKQGSVTLQAGMTTSEGRSHLQIKVEDTGVGISKSEKALLFAPFTQVNGSQNEKIEGAGLGLTLVRSLTNMHGGYIKVESQENLGSTFFIYIPIPD